MPTPEDFFLYISVATMTMFLSTCPILQKEARLNGQDKSPFRP